MSHQGGQPRGRRGSVGQPYSALNLRLALASFGLVVSAGFAVACAVLKFDVAALALAAVALTALIDIVVLTRRRRARRRTEAGRRYSMFE
jgi:Family of unknown function (DUF6343)